MAALIPAIIKFLMSKGGGRGGGGGSSAQSAYNKHLSSMNKAYAGSKTPLVDPYEPEGGSPMGTALDSAGKIIAARK